MTITANEIKFGIEIECTIPVAAITFQIGGYHNGCEIFVNGTDGWKAEKDVSIQALPGFTGVEFVSPVMSGVDGLNQVLAMLDWLNSIGAKVNRSCGLHITTTFPIWDVKAMRRLIHFTARHEDAIYASTGSKWRQETCGYAREIKHAFKPLEGMGSEAKFQQHRYTCNAKYRGLNLAHAYRGKARIEFRYFAGTLNATKMAGYIQMVLGIVERSLTSSTTSKWEGALDGSRAKGCKAGTGRKALAQLLMELRWVSRGPGVKAYGMLQEGTTDIRKVLTKMADKYDAR